MASEPFEDSGQADVSGHAVRRLGVAERLVLDRKIRWAFGWYVLMLGTALADWVLGMFGLGWPTLLALQAPALLRRIGFSVVFDGLGGISIPLGPACAIIVCCLWAWVGYWLLKGAKGAFVIAILALVVDSLAMFAGMLAGRYLGLWEVGGFVALRVLVLGSWISVWRRLRDLEEHGYSVERSE